MFYKYIWIGRKKISIRKRWLKKIEKKNVTIAVKVLNAKKENIYPVYVSKKIQIRKSKILFYWFQTEKDYEIILD